jgi:hypothetical protein
MAAAMSAFSEVNQRISLAASQLESIFAVSLSTPSAMRRAHLSQASSKRPRRRFHPPVFLQSVAGWFDNPKPGGAVSERA